MATRYPGLRFLPTDEELLFDYLMRRLNQEPLPDPDVIRELDLYGGDPWNIFGKDRDEKFYVFTTLKMKNRSRVDRTAGSGTWKAEQSYKIRDSRGEVAGLKKLFTFKAKATSSAGAGAEADGAGNGHWIMYEYSKYLHDDQEDVLCVISNKHAEELSKKACRNPHGRAQLEEENPLAKKARQFRDDHTRGADVPSAASLTSATAAAQAPPSTAPPSDEAGVVIPQDDVCYATDSPASRADRSVNALPPAAADIQEDTRLTASPAFGGANAVPLSATNTAAPLVDREWADRLKNLEISPLVKSLFCAVVKQRAEALHARNNPVEPRLEGVSAHWPDRFLDFSRCI